MEENSHIHKSYDGNQQTMREFDDRQKLNLGVKLYKYLWTIGYFFEHSWREEDIMFRQIFPTTAVGTFRLDT